MERQSGAVTIAAALIVAAALVGSSAMITSSLEATTEELAAVRAAIATGPLGAAPQRRAQAQRPARPDPEKRYSISVDGAPSWGPDSAKVTVVEFSDFQCPFCGRVWPTLQRLRGEYGDDVRIVFKHMPLNIHPKARGAHIAAEAAHRQGKFWEMHNKIFAKPRQLDDATFAAYATELGLDVDQFQQDLKSPDVQKKVDADIKEAASVGVSGTPGFFINGRFLSGAQPFESFKSVIDEEIGQG
jgi:protein-disulfide isomerase